jgi:hypothetical protein
VSNRPKRNSRSGRSRPGPQSASTAPSRSFRRVAAVTGVAVAAIVIVVVALIVSGGDSDADTVRVNGLSLPAMTADGVDPAVGLKAPVFSAFGVDGELHTVGSGGGPGDPAKVLLFVSDSCSGCADAVGSTVAWLAENELPALVTIEVVVLDASDDADVWLTTLGWTDARWIDSKQHRLAKAFGIDAPPVWVVHDRQNHVVERVAGAADVGSLVDLAAGTV